MTKVIKFGGSCISSVEDLKKVSEIINKQKDLEQLIIVISAFSGQTDLLNNNSIDKVRDFHNSFSKELGVSSENIESILELSQGSKDETLSVGEKLSLELAGNYLKKQFSDLEIIDSTEFITTDDSGSIDFRASSDKVKSSIANKKLVLTNGFLGKTPDNKITTLGRGGSDYTATFIGYALESDKIEIFTTVDGVLTADPKRVKSAFKLPNLSYKEAFEICHFGSKVIFPKAIQPALEKNIPLYIKNYLNPENEGTLISNKKAPEKFLISGISSLKNISLFRLEGSGLYGVAGIAKRLFETLSKEEISVNLITQASSESSICFAIPQSSSEKAKKAVDNEFEKEIKAHLVNPVSVDQDLAIIAIVGENMISTPGISGRAFQALGKNGINAAAIAQGSSELNISIVVSDKDESKAINVLHDAFFLSGVTTINVFQTGVGQVGKVLLEQIRDNQEAFIERGIKLNVAGIANSKSNYIELDGVDLNSWQENLNSPSDIEKFVEKIKESNLPNSVFVDCTASEVVSKQYLGLLDSSISIVTPNKKANSSSIEDYRNLKSMAKKRNVKFFYETNVGAGLPIISTLNDLIASGDKVLKVEAVLSGTLSYIFNTFDSSKKFSDVVINAKEQGYTEPDPRDDLSGTDVARKLLILAREMGHSLELKDIKVQSLVPEQLVEIKNVSEFLKRLHEGDSYFEQMANKANKENKVLRYIGKIENGQAEVSLQAVGTEHPFYNMSGTDNIIAFVTERYKTTPLVVKGPGAGTAVTAAGALADILRVATYLS